MSENNGSEEKPGRNSPCPCGSGDKYKLCCGKTEQPEPSAEELERTVMVAVEKKVIWEPKAIEVEPVPQNGGANFGFVVLEGGKPVEHIYVLDEHEKAEVLRALSGGLVIP